ncbi:hypothetical protein ABIF68_003394 [Bradyrhizobium japonicum]|jgi:hypothetical protein|uniref:hypothetical protein n=1 Tax=Bradyrhizobium japonicum TaxID=375 RepID=UPI0004AFA473|nr:hypothetical protein [Bradyrhizobium japonicum]
MAVSMVSAMMAVTMAMAMAMAVTMSVAALGECGVWHGKAGRDDQCCGERKFLHPKSLLLGTHLAFDERTSIAVSRANAEES